MHVVYTQRMGHLKADVPREQGAATPTSALLLHHEDTKALSFPAERTGIPDITSFFLSNFNMSTISKNQGKSF